MNAIEREFQKDCNEKKKIGRNVQRRAGRGGSKKCSLPSDNLTQKEWKKLNGEVQSICLTKQMDWNEFRALSKGLQEEYLKNLIENYGARQADIARMFCRTSATLCQYIKENELNIKFEKSGNKAKNKKWVEFINGNVTMNKVMEKEYKPIEVNPVEEIRKEAKELGIELPVRKKYIRGIKGMITAEGKPSVILDKIYKAMDPTMEYKITIKFQELKTDIEN